MSLWNLKIQSYIIEDSKQIRFIIFKLINIFNYIKLN